MADEHLKDVASAVVDDVINGVTTELNKFKGSEEKVCKIQGTSKDRSLLCVLFDPSKYLSVTSWHNVLGKTMKVLAVFV